MKIKSLFQTLALTALVSAPAFAESQAPTLTGEQAARLASTLVSSTLHEQPRFERFNALVNGYYSSVEIKITKDLRGNPVENITLKGMAVIQGDIACGDLALKITKKLKPTRAEDAMWGRGVIEVYSLKYEAKNFADYCRDSLRD